MDTVPISVRRRSWRPIVPTPDNQQPVNVQDDFSGMPNDVLLEIIMNSDMITLINLSSVSSTMNTFLSQPTNLRLLEDRHNLPHSKSFGQLARYSTMSPTGLVTAVVENNNFEFAKNMLESAVDNDNYKELLKTSLESAARTDSLEFVNTILELDSKHSCLHNKYDLEDAVVNASHNGNLEIIIALLSHHCEGEGSYADKDAFLSVMDRASEIATSRGDTHINIELIWLHCEVAKDF